MPTNYTSDGRGTSEGCFVQYTPGTTPVTWPTNTSPGGGEKLITRSIIVGSAGTITFTDAVGNTVTGTFPAGRTPIQISAMTTPATATGILLGF